MSDRASLRDGLDPIEPLVEFYEREMGQLAGRLMVALSLMVDLEDTHGWADQPAQARDTVRYSRLLVASVLRIVATAQAQEGDALGMAEAIDDNLQRLFKAQNGNQGS